MQDDGTIIDPDSDLGQVRRGVDIGGQFSMAASAAPGSSASENTARP
jgi:hypothetical protein